MNILIAGSRDFKNLNWVKDYLYFLVEGYNDLSIISGGAPGVDSIAEQYAHENDIPYKIYLADWEKHGKKAGPIRNEEMVKVADKVVCFWDGKSKGTKTTIDYALKYKKDLEVIFDAE